MPRSTTSASAATPPMPAGEVAVGAARRAPARVAPFPRWAVWGLALGFLLMLLNLGFRNFPGDMILYFDYANHVKDGHVPYRDFALEYPPLALAPILSPFYVSRLFGGFFMGFERMFALEMYLLALAGGWLVWRLMDDVLPSASDEERRWRLAAYVVAWPLLGQMVSRRIDLLPAVLVVLALWLWLREREGWAWLALAVGVAAKLFPVVVAPLFALDLLRRRGWRAALLGGLWFSLCVALLFLPALIASPSGLWHMFSYHSQRGIQIESLWANGEMLLARVSSFHVVTAHAFGAFETVSSWTPRLRMIATLTQLVGLAGVYALFVWRERPHPPATHLLLAITAATVVFIIGGKVFSPQYFIWLIPLGVLLPGAAGLRALKVFMLTLALTQVLFPYGYHQLVIESAFGLGLLTLRNLVLLVWVWQLAGLFVRGAQASGEPLASVPVAPAPRRA
jgi:hypothetical protein